MRKLSPSGWLQVYLGGLVLITVGFAASVGLRPAEVLPPLMAVVGSLSVMTTAGSGPRAFL